jgi:site-specific DNA recombinase
LSLAFVAPPIIDAAIEGRLPRGFGAKRLMDLPIVWSDQWTALGLKAPTWNLDDTKQRHGSNPNGT